VEMSKKLGKTSTSVDRILRTTISLSWRYARRHLALDDMWPKLDCPWCGKDVGSPANLGTRPSESGPKWYQFTLSGRSVVRPASVCPYCSNPVKTSQRSQRWILLVVPFFVASLVNLITFPEFHVPTWAMWALSVLGVIGGILARVTTHLEKTSVT